ncbi:3-mercaptopropionate dioxygenase [soil metagenome]
MNMVAAIRPHPNLARLRGFVGSIAELVETTSDQATILRKGALLLESLIASDDWLPDEFSQPDPARYQQYLLHCDSRERFSVVSFVWGPGQSTPIHDHRIWGLVGVLRGAERVESFRRGDNGVLNAVGDSTVVAAGQVDSFSPSTGDIHRVSNLFDDRVSVSIHLYGANIGAVERSTYDEAGHSKRFISGYANTVLPNLWDKSTAL